MLNRLTVAVMVGLVLMVTKISPAPIVNKTILKQYFQTGDRPTEAQFASLIDSFLQVDFDFGPSIDEHSLRLGLSPGGVSTSTGWAIGHEHNASIGPGLTYTQSGGLGAGSDWPGFSGFVGLEFELDPAGLGPTTHYGFLHMSVDDATSNTPYAIRLIGFAYETDPDTPITTFFLPEPASVGLMVLACVGLFGRRRTYTADL